jgi:quercetin dioxygenase-like cupin family protein
MMTADLNKLDLLEAWSEQDPNARMKVNFPFFSSTGAKSSAVVYMVLEPGHRLGRHSDSAEEVVLVLEGTARGTIGDEQAELSAGGMVLIPAMVPHDFENVGAGVMRAVGFFSSASVVSTFDDPLQPMNRRILGTPLPPEPELEAPLSTSSAG